MTTMSLRLCVLLAAIALPLAAQQLEPNTPGGTCTVNGTGPTGAANPIQVGSTAALTVAVQGTASSAYSLYFGSLSPVSLGIPSGQFIDFNLAAPFTTIVDGINFGLSAAGLPSVFGNTGPSGSSSWTFPASPNLIGLTGCFQAAVIDPANIIGVNITGAPQFTVTPFGASGVGDDVLFQYALPFPVTLYGVVSQNIAVTTNGYVLLAGSGTRGTFGSLGENSAQFINGDIGGAAVGSGPAIAAHWDDLDVGNNPTQSVTTTQAATGTVAVSWLNADYFPATPVGTITLTIDSNANTLTFDYSGFTGNQQRGLIGVTSGGAPATTAVQRDLVSGGTVTPYVGAASETVFQNFNAGEPFAGPMDVGGLTLTFIDAGIGQWVIL